MIGLLRKLDSVNTLEEKKWMMAFFDDIRVNIFSLSCTGRLDLTDCEKYIQAMHLYSSGSNDILIDMMSVGATTKVDFIQPFADECYVNAFRELLAQAGIQLAVSERISFTTPRDGIADTPAVEALRRSNNLLQNYLDSLA